MIVKPRLPGLRLATRLLYICERGSLLQHCPDAHAISGALLLALCDTCQHCISCELTSLFYTYATNC